jgi:hypothetical protein
MSICKNKELINLECLLRHPRRTKGEVSTGMTSHALKSIKNKIVIIESTSSATDED